MGSGVAGALSSIGPKGNCRRPRHAAESAAKARGSQMRQLDVTQMAAFIAIAMGLALLAAAGVMSFD